MITTFLLFIAIISLPILLVVCGIIGICKQKRARKYPYNQAKSKILFNDTVYQDNDVTITVTKIETKD